ncbi:hypothetical protein POTOM_020665 [Populus tomentosa]|uniref:Uncharacterized protein n=1 Tax=Populus tomentosa TaxID=118781 RepID=A0A8X8D0M6_POPTO|nr:hypothetical protein POTOM_020665 [Populus tomentosa]
MLSLTCPPMYLSSSFPPERAAGFWVYCNDRFQRGVKRKPMASIKKLREASSDDCLCGVTSAKVILGASFCVHVSMPFHACKHEQKREAPDGEKPDRALEDSS